MRAYCFGRGRGGGAKAHFYVHKALAAGFDFMKEEDWEDCE